jgi:hypothetical protein
VHFAPSPHPCFFFKSVPWTGVAPCCCLWPLTNGHCRWQVPVALHKQSLSGKPVINYFVFGVARYRCFLVCGHALRSFNCFVWVGMGGGGGREEERGAREGTRPSCAKLLTHANLRVFANVTRACAAPVAGLDWC